MYAVILTGGKQYKVQEGDIIFVEKLDGEPENTVVFEQILATNKDGETKFGAPYIADATVSAKVLRNGKAKKIMIFKYKAKKNYRKRQGHRQPYTKLQIEKISV